MPDAYTGTESGDRVMEFASRGREFFLVGES
jgi:hypothetical protein